jgi:hypothetical protein
LQPAFDSAAAVAFDATSLKNWFDIFGEGNMAVGRGGERLQLVRCQIEAQHLKGCEAEDSQNGMVASIHVLKKFSLS